MVDVLMHVFEVRYHNIVIITVYIHTHEDNIIIVEAVHKYIKNTKRFTSYLFNMPFTN